MPMNKTLFLLGYASDIAGAGRGSAKGPILLKQSPYLSELSEQGLTLHWQTLVKSPYHEKLVLPEVVKLCGQLATEVAREVREKHFFTVLGGDHTSAIGTWSGAAMVKKEEGPIGLIWIDAHMDSHTPETSLSGNIHGMPLACLLGHGDTSLTYLTGDAPKLYPEHVCLVGVRSYEEHEADLLNQLNIRIFYMDEVKQRGLTAVFQDALQIATTGTCGYGLSVDVDSIDPSDAPGTSVAEADGLSAEELCQSLTLFADDPRLLGFEIAEFDPSRDIHHQTEKVITHLISAITLGKF